MRSSRQLLLLGLLVVSLVAASCVPGPEETTDSEEEATVSDELDAVDVPRTTVVPTMRPTPAEDLGIALDPDGRPYDNYWGPQGATTEMRLLTRFEVPGGRIELIEGEAFRAAGPVNVRDTTTIDFRESGQFDLRVVWEQRPEPADGANDADSDDQGSDSDSDDGDSGDGDENSEEATTVESVLGVMVGLTGRSVARWGEFALAYDTEDALGGITTRSVLDWADGNLEPDDSLVTEDFIEGRPFILGDLDGESGRDLFLFDHRPVVEVRSERTDGRYLYTRGFDENDRLVAIMLWDGRYPWRLAVTEGEPPPDIAEREDQLIDCIEGRRLIDKWGRCT